MQGHAPVPARSEQGVATLLLVLPEEGDGKPCRLIAVQDLPRFFLVAHPKNVKFRGALAALDERSAG